MWLANKYVLGAAGLLLALAAVWGYGHYQYRQGVADTQTAARLAAYDQYQSEVEAANAKAYDAQNRITELENNEPETIVKYRTITKTVPLPATCRIDPDRLRNIAGAINKAAAARKSGSAVPAGKGIQ